jgi:hypothetical protein
LNPLLAHADIRYIPNPIGELAANPNAVEITARWLAQMPGILSAARRVHAE